jgi:hypothetical protein
MSNKTVPQPVTDWLNSSLRRQIQDSTEFSLSREEINQVLALNSELSQRRIICSRCRTTETFQAFHFKYRSDWKVKPQFFTLCTLCKQREFDSDYESE